jgi:hypothetical protein
MWKYNECTDPMRKQKRSARVRSIGITIRRSPAKTFLATARFPAILTYRLKSGQDKKPRNGMNAAPGLFHSLAERLPANHRSDFGEAGERDVRVHQLTHLLSCMRCLSSA